MKFEVAVLGFLSLIVLMASVDVKQTEKNKLSTCVKVEVAILGFLSLWCL